MTLVSVTEDRDGRVTAIETDAGRFSVPTQLQLPQAQLLAMPMEIVDGQLVISGEIPAAAAAPAKLESAKVAEYSREAPKRP